MIINIKLFKFAFFLISNIKFIYIFLISLKDFKNILTQKIINTKLNFFKQKKPPGIKQNKNRNLIRQRINYNPKQQQIRPQDQGNKKMNPKDFDGVYKWKFLVPIVYIVNWSLVIIGPLLIPYAYQIFCMSVIVYSLLKGLGLCLGTLVALIKLKKTLKHVKTKMQMGVPLSSDQYFHAMVIPSYKQDQQVLLQTINILSKSPRAKTQFIVFLAMEAHQEGSDIKANKLIQKSKQKFYHMDFTQHVIRPGEAKGKASNVSWCVEHFEQKLANLMIDFNKIIVTVLDADSWAPKQYFEVVEEQLEKRPQIKDLCMFSAPQIFTRNHLKVPLLNRCYDTMHSLAQLSNLVAVKFRFPLSNYSVSYNLMKRIGWWDTCADAIGEDFHTTQKCYWKTEKQTFHTIPIFIPFNQLSLSTGNGCFKDMIARFWQAQRHCLGVSDVAYCWHMLFNTRFRFTNLWMTLIVTQVYLMTAFIPWALLGLGIQYSFLDTSLRYFPMVLIQLLLNGATFFSGASYIFYEWWRRIANWEVYKLQNDKWWRVLEFPLNFPVALFGFSIPAFVMGSFSVLCTTTQYRVAEKRIQKPNSIIQKVASARPNFTQKKNSLIKYKEGHEQKVYQQNIKNKIEQNQQFHSQQLNSSTKTQQKKNPQIKRQIIQNNKTSDAMVDQNLLQQQKSGTSSSGGEQI